LRSLAKQNSHAKTPRRKEEKEESLGSRHENEVATIIVDTAFKIHSTLGPGLLESVYEAILAYELRKRGLKVLQQVPMGLNWDNLQFDIGFRADLLVDDLVIVELKSVERMMPVYAKKLLTYLRLADKRLGLLINFGAPLIRDGIKRVANGLVD
jgi:GxxExxY protein